MTHSCCYSRLFHDNTENQQTLNNSRTIVYRDTIEMNGLPLPLDARCTPSHDWKTCYEEYFIDEFKVINRYSWSGFYSERLNLKIVTPIDFLNETISRSTQKSLKNVICCANSKPNVILNLPSQYKNRRLKICTLFLFYFHSHICHFRTCHFVLFHLLLLSRWVVLKCDLYYQSFPLILSNGRSEHMYTALSENFNNNNILQSWLSKSEKMKQILVVWKR